jgi:CHASE1-domain containing sensor protein
MTWTRFRKYFPWLLLCAGLACTYGMKRWALENARHKLMAQFEQQSAELMRQTELRMALQQQILRGVAGFVGHGTAVDPSELHGYIA